MIIEHRVKGIPCWVKVNFYHDTPPWRGPIHRCDSDWDYYGNTEIDFNILDRRGRPAPWLEAKLSDADRTALESEIIEYIKSGDNDE
jgi:hypothetical protein